MNETKFILISPKNRTVYNFRGDLIKEIQNKGYEVVVTGPDKTDIEKIEELNVKFCEICMKKNGTSIAGDLRYLHSLYLLMKKEKPDVVLGYTIKPVVYGAIAARLAGVKNINGMVTGGGYTFISKSLKARILKIIVKTLYKLGFLCCTNVIFQNPDDLDEFTGMHLVNKNKCHIVNGSGVNMERFTPSKPPADIKFLMISRLLKSKGVGEYLEAARQVKRRHPEVEFELLGKIETNMQDALPAEYINSFIQDGTLVRYEETNDVRPYYQNCSVYVLPSYREGTPRTVLEAMACARAIITTDAIGCRSTVDDGETGFLVPVGEVEMLAEKMEWFIDHPDEISKMGNASLKYCRMKFEVTAVNHQMLEIMSI